MASYSRTSTPPSASVTAANIRQPSTHTLQRAHRETYLRLVAWLVSGRERWLDSGLEALPPRGRSGLRIDRLVRVWADKGRSSTLRRVRGYKSALLERLEAEATASLDEPAAGSPTQAHQLLEELTAHVGQQGSRLWRPELEIALRAWSFSDGEVQQTQARIDRQRLTALEAIWQHLEPDQQQARIKALLPYLVAVGASMSRSWSVARNSSRSMSAFALVHAD